MANSNSSRVTRLKPYQGVALRLAAERQPVWPEGRQLDDVSFDPFNRDGVHGGGHSLSCVG